MPRQTARHHPVDERLVCLHVLWRQQAFAKVALCNSPRTRPRQLLASSPVPALLAAIKTCCLSSAQAERRTCITMYLHLHHRYNHMLSPAWLLSATTSARTDSIRKEHALALSICYFIVEPEPCSIVSMAANMQQRGDIRHSIWVSGCAFWHMLTSMKQHMLKRCTLTQVFCRYVMLYLLVAERSLP